MINKVMNQLLKAGERLDDLQLDGYQIIQHPERFCFGIDAVMLSDFTRVKAGEEVLDLGTGTGILPILLAAKTQAKHLTGLEIQEASVDMARRSVQYNHLEERIEIVQGDIKAASTLFAPQSKDVIVTNPPYMMDHHGLKNPTDEKAIARHEILCNLEDIVRESAKLLKESRGRFYMIHKPFRLAEILYVMCQYKIEPKRIQFIHPYIDKEPTMVMIEGLKGGKSRVKIEPPIIMYQRNS